MNTASRNRSVVASVLLSALGCQAAWSASAQVSVVYNFGTKPGDAEAPSAELTLGSDGAFYGTSQAGGSLAAGTVFKITPAGVETVLYSFGSIPGDGDWPTAGLLRASDGLFYGTTLRGGPQFDGTIFRISALGVYEQLYAFGDASADGADPWSTLVEAPDGYLYGATLGGGPYQTSDGFSGTLYRISKTGSYTQMYAFGASPSDGEWPFAALTVGSDGGLYGTTYKSGPRGQPALIDSGGTFFRFEPGAPLTTLHNFHSPATCGDDGAAPDAALILGTDGNFYGTTRDGGQFGRGTLFKISPTGQETVLYSFGSIPGDGREPTGRLLRLDNGTLLGTTTSGGANEGPDNAGGTIFMLSPDGTYTLLYSFGATETDGQFPGAGLTRGPDGNYYGTTIAGGSTADRANGNIGAGIVYKLVIDNSGTAPMFRSVPAPQYACSSGDSGGEIDLALLFVLGLGVAARRRRLISSTWPTPTPAGTLPRASPR